MKKSLVSLVLVMILLFSTLQLTGCYIVKSGKLKNVEGTYQLTSYSTNKNEIEENGIELYIVIKSDGKGYYTYKDNDTELYFSELRCRFLQDTEDSKKYSYVEIDFHGNNEWETFGVNSTMSRKTLNFSKPKWKGNIIEGNLAIDYTIGVTFTRVDKSTDLSYIKKNVGDKPVVPYGAKNFIGVYFYSDTIFDNPDIEAMQYESPFVYFYLHINCLSGRGEVWYMLKEDEVRVNKTITVSISYVENAYSITLDDKVINAYSSGKYVRYLRIPCEATIAGGKSSAVMECSFYSSMTAENIEEDIQFKIDAYQNSKAETEQVE